MMKMLKEWFLYAFSIFLILFSATGARADDDSADENPFASSNNNNNHELEDESWAELGGFIASDDFEGLIESRAESGPLEIVHAQLVIDLARWTEWYLYEMDANYDPEIVCRLDTFLEHAYNEWLKCLFEAGVEPEDCEESRLKVEIFFFHAKKSIVAAPDLESSYFWDSGPGFQELLQANVENRDRSFVFIQGNGPSRSTYAVDPKDWWVWFCRIVGL